MSYPERYTIAVPKASTDEFNDIVRLTKDFYISEFKKDEVAVIEKDKEIYFESVSDEIFIGFDDCFAETISKKYPSYNFNWRRVYAGDYSAVEVTYKNGKITKEKFIDGDIPY